MSYHLHPISFDAVINLIQHGRAGEVYVRVKSLPYPHYTPLTMACDRHLIDWMNADFYKESEA